MWRTVELVIDVRRDFSSEDLDGPLHVSIAIDGAIDPMTALDGFEQLGKVIAPLNDPEVGSQAPDLLTIQQGDLLGQVGESGEVTLSFHPDDGSDFLGDLETMTEVRDSVSEPTDVIFVSIDEGLVTTSE